MAAFEGNLTFGDPFFQCRLQPKPSEKKKNLSISGIQWHENSKFLDVLVVIIYLFIHSKQAMQND